MSEFWLLGNGASLTDEQVSEAEKNTMVVCNSFFRHPRYPNVDVDWWLASDPLYLQGEMKADIERVYSETDCEWFVNYRFEMASWPRVTPANIVSKLTDAPFHHDITKELAGTAYNILIDLGMPLCLAKGASRIVIAGFDLTQGWPHFYPSEPPGEDEWGPFSGFWDIRARTSASANEACAYAKAMGVEVVSLGEWQPT